MLQKKLYSFPKNTERYEFWSWTIMDMINRIKQNRALRPSNRLKFKENIRENVYGNTGKNKRLNFKIVPEEELNEIKHQIRERARRERNKELALYGFFILTGLTTLILILYG